MLEKEWIEWCFQYSVPSNAIFAPKVAKFSLHLFRIGLACLTIGTYCSAISVF